jgi:hypothetical protein
MRTVVMATDAPIWPVQLATASGDVDCGTKRAPSVRFRIYELLLLLRLHLEATVREDLVPQPSLSVERMMFAMFVPRRAAECRVAGSEAAAPRVTTAILCCSGCQTCTSRLVSSRRRSRRLLPTTSRRRCSAGDPPGECPAVLDGAG